MRYLSILAVLMCSLQYLEADGSVSQRLATLSKQATKKAVTALATGTLAVSVVCSGLTGCSFSDQETRTSYADSDNKTYSLDETNNIITRQKETIFDRTHRSTIYSGHGWYWLGRVDPEVDPYIRKSRYLVTFEVNKPYIDGVRELTTTKITANGSIISTIRVRMSKSLEAPDTSASFVIIDDRNERIGWGYKVEFEAVHGFILNYHLDDYFVGSADRVNVVHYLRFTDDDILSSTGSAIGQDGRMVWTWYEKMQEIIPDH